MKAASGKDYLNIEEFLRNELNIEDEALIQKLKTSAKTLDDNDLKEMLPKRSLRSNKYTYGKVLCIAGSDNMPGAALLAATSAYRSGAGMVKVCSTKHVTDIIHINLREAISLTLPDETGFLGKEAFELVKPELSWADVIILGPGLGNNETTAEFVYKVVENSACPIILDADGINVLAKNLGLLKDLKGRCVITPHFGEMSRLTGTTSGYIQDRVLNTALEFSHKHGIVTLLKDCKTVIANHTGKVFINNTGNPSMAKAGSGDVLSGIIAALAAQGMELFSAAGVGAYIHGKAGDLAAEKIGLYGVLASDITEYIPKALTAS